MSPEIPRYFRPGMDEKVGVERDKGELNQVSVIQRKLFAQFEEGSSSTNISNKGGSLWENFFRNGSSENG